MAYTKVNWLNSGETGAKPINKTNLNNMDEGIFENDNLCGVLNDDVDKLKNIITVNVNNTNVTLSPTGTLQFSNIYAQSGDKLTLENNKIKIGAGISYVKISFNIWVTSASGGRFWGMLKKNDTKIADLIQYVGSSNPYATPSFSVMLLEVEENDLIGIDYSINGVVMLNDGSGNINATNLTVEVVK